MATYDGVSIALHGITAALILILWPTGFVADYLPRGPLRANVWSTHVALGFLLSIVLLGRIIWAGTFSRRPASLNSGALKILEKSTHYAMYALLIAAVVLGVLNAFVRSYEIFGVVKLPALWDRELRRPLTYWHYVVANTLVCVALIHAATALTHHYFWRDNVLHRMRR